jgi:CDP-glucose 4,6-dehydratase
LNRDFWRGRKVFITGHTGFKGSWLTQWLQLIEAEVVGYSLEQDDVRDLERLRGAIAAVQPQIVIHLAAQALVRPSYEDPVRTFTTNVIGTVHVLEAIRSVPSVRVAVIATSDKSYLNSGALRAFREDDRLGGTDPYSSSKACAELAINSYRESFFRSGDAARVVSVRAGNVIGGGDWARDRLVPDLVRAFRSGTPAEIRYPEATRPWQFVLDALHGYLLTAEHAWERADLPDTFNFGPDPRDARTVGWLADTMAARWSDGASWHGTDGEHRHEEPTLALDSTRASEWLQWKPLLDAETVVAWTTDWYKSPSGLTVPQIRQFMEAIH